MPSRQDPPLHLAGCIQRKGQADTVGARVAAGVAGRYCSASTSRLRDSAPDFLSGFTPISRWPYLALLSQRPFEATFYLLQGV